MLEKTRAIVLNLIKYSDSSSIAHVYTENYGRISIMVRHSKGRKSVSKKSILQPLFLLDIQINKKQNHEIHFASELTNYPIFHSIPFNVFKSSISLFVAEILSKVLLEEELNHELFAFLINSIIFLDQVEHGTSNFHLVFLYELSRYLGFYPADNYSSQNKYFNLREGFYSERFDIPEITLSEILSKNLHTLKEKGFKDIAEIKMERTQKSELLNSIIKFYQYHLPGMGKIRSLEILSEVFKL